MATKKSNRLPYAIPSNFVADPACDLGAIRKCAEGDYRQALVDGHRNFAGSDLKGNAKRYGDVYARSRQSLLRRIESLGYLVERVLDARGRVRVIVTPWQSAFVATEEGVRQIHF